MAVDGEQGTIVVGVDGSDCANEALEWALAEARLRGATLEVVMAWEFPLLPYYVQSSPPPVSDLEAAAQKTLEETAGRLLAGDTPVVTSLVEGDAANALITASLHADLLVVGTRGRGGFAGLVLGSVSSKCVSHSACPVVIVPPSQVG